jgi:hypothetical protein
VERWWLWLLLVAVLVAVTVADPLIGLLVTALTAVVLTRASGVGSPFRPARCHASGGTAGHV